MEEGYAGVEGEGDEVGEGGAVRGASQGGDVAEVIDELSAEHGVKFAFDEEEGGVTDPEVGTEEGGRATSNRVVFGKLGFGRLGS